MRIDSIKLTNFRNFEHREFRFHPNFTIVIGQNGAGKSTILYALKVLSGTYLLNFPNINNISIYKYFTRSLFNEKTKDYDYYSPVILEATWNKDENTTINWRRELASMTSKTSTKYSDVGQLTDIADKNISILKSNSTERNPTLPVIKFYGLGRLSTQIKIFKKKKRNIIVDGYFNYAGDKADHYTYVQWMNNYEKNLKDGLEFNGTYKAVLNAITQAVPFIQEIFIDSYERELEAYVKSPSDGTLVRMHQSTMSDGLRTMVGMVADIAYRCAILNGHLGIKCVKETEGVVLIDELDMHLHPNWQRTVVADLQKAFPKIQFVVTTHSPFIIQSVQASQIINLEHQDDTNPNELAIGEVANNIMNVESEHSVNYENKYKESKEALSGKTSANFNNITDPVLKAILELKNSAKK